MSDELRAALQRASDLILDIGDRLGDEGDRVYLGSTNDAETIRNLGHEIAELLA